MIPTVISNNIEEVKTLMAPYVPSARGLLPVVACVFFTIFMVEMYRMFTACNAPSTDCVVARRVAGRVPVPKEVKRGWGGVVVEEKRRRGGVRVEKKVVEMGWCSWALNKLADFVQAQERADAVSDQILVF